MKTELLLLPSPRIAPACAISLSLHFLASDALTLASSHQADFVPQLKVAPEWAPVLSAVQSAGSSARRRRKLNGHMWEGSATKSAIDALHVHGDVDLAPHLVVLASFPLGLVSRSTAAPPKGSGTKKRKAAAWDLPAAAAEDWEAALMKLVSDSGAACRPILTPAASGVRVAVCPQVRVPWGGGGAYISTCLRSAQAIHSGNSTSIAPVKGCQGRK